MAVHVVMVTWSLPVQADLSSKELSKLTPAEAKEKSELEARLDDLQVATTPRITRFPISEVGHKQLPDLACSLSPSPSSFLPCT